MTRGLTDGQARLRAIVSAYPQDGDVWDLRAQLGADPVILADPLTGQPLSAVGAHATYARFQARRWADRAEICDRVTVDVDHHAYGRPDENRHEAAALGGVKAHRTMRFLLDHAAGLQPETGDVGLVVLTGSRISCEASAQHRALAAFLWRSELVAARPQIEVIADEPDPVLREACATVDRYALHADGFAMPFGCEDHDSYRIGLLELAARLRVSPLARRYSHLSDLEQALTDQAQPPPAPARSRWWRR